MSTIVVTGASAGLGLSISKYLLADSRKHRLILCCNSNDKSLKELANDPANADRVFIIKGDTADENFVKTVFAQSLVHFQIDRIDSLVLNHGILGDGTRVADGTQEMWEKVFRVNFFSVVGIVCIDIGVFMTTDHSLRSNTPFLTYARVKAVSYSPHPVLQKVARPRGDLMVCCIQPRRQSLTVIQVLPKQP